MKNIIIVDENNRLVADVNKKDEHIVYSHSLVDIDFFENDIRIRLKKDIVPDDKEAVSVIFQEDKNADSVSPVFINNG